MSDRFSHSKIETYRSCPRQYRFRYVERVKVEKEITIELYVGQVLHKCLQKLYDVQSVGKTLSLDETLAIYDEEWERAPLETLKVGGAYLSAKDYIENGRQALTDYHTRYEPFDQSKTLAVEARVEFTLDPERGFKITGFIDRLARKEDGSVEIIDYKYKKGLPRQDALDRDPQLALYTLAAKENWPDFKNVTAKLIYLKQDTEFTVNFDDDTLEEIRYELVQQILDIKRAEREDDFPPKESPLCNWCPYFQLCPAKRHAISLEDEEVPPEEIELRAHETAEKFLALKRKMDSGKGELEILRLELVDYANKLRLTSLEGKQGTVKISQKEVEAFPTKTKNRESFMAITELVKQCDTDLFEAFAEIKPNDIYKAYIREQLPESLREKLKDYLYTKQDLRVTARYTEQTSGNE